MLGHNFRRMELVEGKVPGQPKAALMYTMVGGCAFNLVPVPNMYITRHVRNKMFSSGLKVVCRSKVLVSLKSHTVFLV